MNKIAISDRFLIKSKKVRGVLRGVLGFCVPCVHGSSQMTSYYFPDPTAE
jgi:hypothetical protein